MEYISENAEQTENLGYTLAKELKGGEVVLLNGELGAGKTTFSKGLAKGLGVSEMITSPTFTLLNIYQGKNLFLYHFDMYRLTDGSDSDYGFDEYYGLSDRVCLIEWTVAKDYFGAKVISVDIEYLSATKRKICVKEI